ncbi:MAG: YdeI/OmpD-associated family protein [Chloroflexota bacterium]
MSTTFITTVYQEPGKNATGLPVPPEAIAALGKGKRPPVKVTINNYTYRTTVAVMGGEFMLSLSAENREAAQVAAGEEVEVTLELDTEPRTVELPPDLTAALAAAPGATSAFDTQSYSVRKEDVRQVESAKTEETRQRRIAKIVSKLTAS